MEVWQWGRQTDAIPEFISSPSILRKKKTTTAYGAISSLDLNTGCCDVKRFACDINYHKQNDDFLYLWM